MRALEGAFNFRDLGGLRLTDGRRVRAGRLMRSDTLQALSNADATALVNGWGLRTVVDLRLAHEVAAEGRGLLAGRSQVKFVESPLDMASADGVTPDQILVAMYERCLESSALPHAITAIAEYTAAPTLFHCAAGKDRTGVVAALVLDLLGVDREEIVRDYMRSDKAMPSIVARFMTWPRYRDQLATLPPEAYAVEERPIRHLLATVDERFGGARGWATSRAIAPSSIERLERHLVERD